MPLYRPRVAASIVLPNVGTSEQKKIQDEDVRTITLPFRVRKCRLVYNDHNAADECELTCEATDAPVDVRLLRNGVITVRISDIGENALTEHVPSEDDTRFIGIVTHAKRGCSEDDGYTLEIHALDYTSLFLACKHPVTSILNTINYDDNLTTAWGKLCDATAVFDDEKNPHSTVAVLKNRIRFEGNSTDVALGDAVIPRMRKIGRPQFKPGLDAWACWQQIVISLGLISYIDRDSVVVTTSTDYYTVDDPAVFSLGTNVLSISEERDCNLVRKGCHCISYDPTTNKTLEAFYPPPTDERVHKKQTVARTKAGKGTDALLKSCDYEIQYYPSVTNPDRLQEVAKRIFDERARQELAGALTTLDMRVKSRSGANVDVLDLRTGDAISVEFDTSNGLELQSKGSKNLQLAYLVERGYSPDVANYIVENVQDLTIVNSMFHVVQNVISISTDEESADFEICIRYVNMVSLDGGMLTEPGF